MMDDVKGKLLNHLLAFLLSGLFFAVGCGSETNDPATPDLSEDFEVGNAAETLELDDQLLDDIIPSIPSPIEISAVIQASGASYSNKILNPTRNKDGYHDNFTKALNLGIYGADLAYMNIYGQNTETVEYLATINDLADDFKIAHFFDFVTLKRIAANNGATDSLIEISAQGFSKMNNYLDDHNRRNVSTLMLTGTWIEGMYLATRVQSQVENDELRERIGEQKFTLDNLLLLLSAHQQDPKMAGLIAQMQLLRTAYEAVEITVDEGAATSVEVNGVLMIEDESMSTVTISEETMETISETVAALRTKIISQE